MPKLVVRTELNTDDFEKQMSTLEKKYENKEIDIDITSKELSEAEKQLDRINEKLDGRIARESEIRARLEEQNKKQFKSQTLINDYKEELSAVQDEQLKLYDAWDKQNMVVEKLTGKLDKQKNDLSEIQGKINNMQVQQVQGNIDKISAGVKGVVKNVVKWGLAVFSIRSAYMLVRNAINTISQNDEQLKADIDYMKNALAYVLEPIVRKIVEWAKQLVFYIGYIIKAWTGHDIFAKANKNVKKTVGGVKELKKQLSGFDEMNILSDSGGTESGGVTGPSFNFEDMQVPKWLEEIGKLLDYFKDPTWENFGRVIQGLGIIVAGLGIAFLSLPVTIAGAIVLIIGTMMKYWEEIKAFINDKIFAWLDEKIENLSKTTIGKFFATFLAELKRVISDVVHILDGLFKGIRQIFDGIILIFRGQFWQGILSILKGLLNAVISALNLLIAGLNTLVAPLRAIIVGFGKIAGQNWSMENIRIPQIPYLAKGGIVNMPGRGVPIGSAIGGEKGQEGVIPLTDSQQMALLGEAIGKYITINASITNTMNGRVISKELQKINAENDFAYNR